MGRKHRKGQEACAAKFLADQLTLSQQEVVDNAQIPMCPSEFSDPPAALNSLQ